MSENKGIEGEVVREVHLKISPQYASVQVISKADEKNDRNFPHNLHNAAELFLRVGMVENAERLRESTDSMINIYASNPDGKTGMRIGNGCVCWSCGYCGIPKDYKDDKKSLNSKRPGPCSNCGELEQINWLKITHKDGKKVKDMPWIEHAPLSEEEQKKKKEAEIAAKRKEIEERVKQALKDRAEKEKNIPK